MNPNTPSGTADLAAQIELHHRRVSKAVAAKIHELADGGLTPHEIASHLGIALHLANLVLRGATPGVSR